MARVESKKGSTEVWMDGGKEEVEVGVRVCVEEDKKKEKRERE